MIYTGPDMAEAVVNVPVLLLEGCRQMCQDRGMVKCLCRRVI